MKAQWLAFYDDFIAGTADESSLVAGLSSIDSDDESLFNISSGTTKQLPRSLLEMTAAERLLKSQWLWARATLQCRAYSFRLSSDSRSQLQAEGLDYQHGDLVAFIPFIGFANHDDSKCCKVSLGNGMSAPVSSFVLHTTDVYHAGEPVCISYGDLSFNQKVLSFGWIDASYGGDGAAPYAEQSSSSSSTAGGVSPLRYHITPIDVTSGSVPVKDALFQSQCQQVEIRTNVFDRRRRPAEHRGRPASKLMSASIDDDADMALGQQVEQLIQSFVTSLTCSRDIAIRTIRAQLTRRQANYTEVTRRLRSTSLQEKISAATHDLTIQQALLIVAIESNSVQAILTELQEH